MVLDLMDEALGAVAVNGNTMFDDDHMMGMLDPLVDGNVFNSFANILIMISNQVSFSLSVQRY